MKDDDLGAAARRLLLAREWFEERGKGTAAYSVVTGDGADLARAWLADHPADEGDDASPEWLCGIGAFHRPMQPAGSHMVSTREAVEQDDGTVLPVVAIQFPPPPRGHRVPVWVVWVYGHPRCLNECPTRQYVRRLCQALNIPLAEGR